MRLPADNSAKYADTAAGRFPMGIPTWRGTCIPYSIWVSGTVISMERDREIHFMCKGRFLLITNVLSEFKLITQHILSREGFEYCGLIQFDGGPKLAYEWDR